MKECKFGPFILNISDHGCHQLNYISPDVDLTIDCPELERQDLLDAADAMLGEGITVASHNETDLYMKRAAKLWNMFTVFSDNDNFSPAQGKGIIAETLARMDGKTLYSAHEKKVFPLSENPHQNVQNAVKTGVNSYGDTLGAQGEFADMERSYEESWDDDDDFEDEDDEDNYDYLM